MIQHQETIRIGQNERKPSEMLFVLRAFYACQYVIIIISFLVLIIWLEIQGFSALMFCQRCLRLLYLKAQPAEMGLGVNNLGLELTSANFVR